MEAHKVTIFGSGFGTQKLPVDIRVAGIRCQIVNITPSCITCIVRAAANSPSNIPNYGRLQTDTPSTQIDGFISGTGTNYRRYSSLSDLQDRTVQGIINGIEAGTVGLREQGNIPDLEINGSLPNSIYRFKGYFKPPRDDKYIFRVSTNDPVFMFLSPYTGCAEVDYNDPLIFHNSSFEGDGVIKMATY